MATQRQIDLYNRLVPAAQRERHDGGLSYGVDDHIEQLRRAQKTGIGPEELAEVLGVPAEYFRELSATL